MLHPEQWLDLHGDILFRFALVRLRDAERAEEAVQETLLAALSTAGSFDGRSSERTWLIGILRHKIVDQMRRAWREVPASTLDDADADHSYFELLFDNRGHWHGHQPQRWGDPRAALHAEDFWQALRACMARLPGKLADAFMLKEVEQMDSEAVCQVLNISATNLWAIMHRARTRLRECLSGHWFNRPKAPQGKP